MILGLGRRQDGLHLMSEQLFVSRGDKLAETASLAQEQMVRFVAHVDAEMIGQQISAMDSSVLVHHDAVHGQ